MLGVGEDILNFGLNMKLTSYFNLWVQMKGKLEDMKFNVIVLGPPHEDILNPWSSQQKEKAK